MSEKSVNIFVIQSKSPSRAWYRRTPNFGMAGGVIRSSRYFLTIDSAAPPRGPAKAWTPNARFLRGSARWVSSLQAASMGSKVFSAKSTNINHGLALIRTYLAISRSHSQPGLSRTTNAIGSGLNLTSLQSAVGRAWPLEIPSAGPVAGAGIPAGGGRSEWDRRPACLLAEHPSHKLADCKAAREETGGTTGRTTGETPVQLRRTATGDPSTGSGSRAGSRETPVQLFPAGNRRQPEVSIA